LLSRKRILHRLCALIYIGLITAHPLMDANSQIVLNIVSSILHEQDQEPLTIIDWLRAKSIFVKNLVRSQKIKYDLLKTVPFTPHMSEDDYGAESYLVAVRAKQAAVAKSLLWLFSKDKAAEKFLNIYLKTGIFLLPLAPREVRKNIFLFTQAIRAMEKFLTWAKRRSSKQAYGYIIEDMPTPTIPYDPTTPSSIHPAQRRSPFPERTRYTSLSTQKLSPDRLSLVGLPTQPSEI